MSTLNTKKQTLSQLGIGKTKFHSELNGGKLKAVKIGTRLYVEQAEIDRYVASLPAYEPGRLPCTKRASHSISAIDDEADA